MSQGTDLGQGRCAVKPDWSDSLAWGHEPWWWVVGRVFQTEGIVCEKAERKETSWLSWHVYLTSWPHAGASPVLGMEGLEKNGGLLPLEQSLPIRKDEM